MTVIREEDGYIAAKKYVTINQAVQVNGREYLFFTVANICMAWIHPDDIDIVLSMTKTCCGGNKKTLFRLATEDDVRRWMNGGGR